MGRVRMASASPQRKGSAARAVTFDGGVDGLTVGPADEGGIGFEALAGFHVDEIGDTVEREIEFGGIEDLDKHHVMAAAAEVGERTEDRIG
jgi:hypothetical protein